MATGTPDYSLQTKTDITAQSIAEIAVDIVGQTIGNLDVDIVAQALSKLDVDISAQSLANLSVVITSAVLGTVDIDLIAQTIGDVNIDVNTQSLAEIIMRPKYGAMVKGSYHDATQATGWYTIFDITAKGVLYGGNAYSYGGAQGLNDIFRLTIDAGVVFEETYSSLYQWGDNQPLGPLFRLIHYDPTNHLYAAGFPSQITFETGVKLEYNAGATLIFDSRLYYAII